MQGSKILIAPSILSADFSRLEQEVSAVATAGADLIHLDIMDGHYVPNLSFGYMIVQTICKMTDLPLDAHLMVTNPQDYITRLAELGVQYVSFHPETVYHPHRLVHAIKEKGMKAGVAVNPGVPLESVNELLPDCDFILLMSVNPGYSGQKFISAVTEKVRQLKEITKQQNLNLLIEVDGGINDKNSPGLIKAGADILVSASYIFNHADYSDAIRSLRSV